MDPTNEQYDPDGDVFRFFDSLDHTDDMVLSPLPLSPQEALQHLPPLLPQEALQQTPQFPQEVLQQTPQFPQEVPQLTMPQYTQEALQHLPPLLPQEVLQQTAQFPQEALQQTPQFPQEVLQQTPQFPQEAPQQTMPQYTQEALQQMPLLPQEALQQIPLILPQEGLQQIQGFDGTNIVSAEVVNMETEVTEPLSVEGVIIAAMENIQIEGSSPTNTSNEAPDEPIFHRYLPGQRDCGGCISLREVLHSSPNRNLNFTVHGGIGTFDHAVFDVEYLGRDGRPSTRELFYVDLSIRSYNWVRSFIVGCVTLLQTDVTGTVHDSLTSFYDTLCADMNTTTKLDEILSADLGSWLSFENLPNFEVGESSNTKEDILEDSNSSFNPVILAPTPMIPSQTQMQNHLVKSVSPAMPVEGNSSATVIVIPETPQAAPVEPADSSQRSSGNQLALQRQRTANMRLPDLAQYLHLPIAEAAKNLGVCSTALKHVCRRNGLERWPSRQIQAIDRQIAKLEKNIYEKFQKNRVSGWLDIKEQIETLQRKKTAIYDKLFQDMKDKNTGGSDQK